MPECFCGCGRRAAISTRSVNKLGHGVNDDVARVVTLMRAGMRSPRGEEFVEAATWLCDTLTRTVHTGVGPGHEVEQDARTLSAYGRAHFSVDAIVAAVWRSGMSTAQAAHALRRGDFDPYADAPPLPAVGVRQCA
jgi:hypothetical protein